MLTHALLSACGRLLAALMRRPGGSRIDESQLDQSNGDVPVKSLSAIGTLVVCLALITLLLVTPAQGAEVPLPAIVTVVSPVDESYGARVYAAERCGSAERALGRPDGSGAILWVGGSVTVELERTIDDCRTIDVWAAKGGLGAGKFKVYVSEDARRWAEVGGGTSTPHYKRYDLERLKGRTVRYVRVEHSGSWFSVVLLDAVSAKGGDG